VGGVIPREYIGPVEQGVKEALENGVLAGYPMVDVKVELVDDRTTTSIRAKWRSKIAGSMAVKEAARQAHPVLLEPMMDVEVVTPSDYMGDVIGDLSARRGKIGGMTQRAGAQVVAGDGAAVGDVRLFDHAALDEPGPRDLQHAVQSLSGSAENQGRRDCVESERIGNGRPWPRQSLSGRSPT